MSSSDKEVAARVRSAADALNASIAAAAELGLRVEIDTLSRRTMKDRHDVPLLVPRVERVTLID